MSRAMTDALRLTLLAALALIAVAPAMAARAAEAAPPRASTDDVRIEPLADNATAAAPPAPVDRQKARRAALRKVAAVCLILILLLICFIVVVMITTRRMRIRYLHYDRKVTFSRLWDVWWHPRGDASADAKQKPKP